jgi:signal transduction histidine kinase
MIADPAGISYFQSVEMELGRVSHIAKQTLGYYREHAPASSASIGEIVLQAITIYEPRCTATGIEIKKSINSSRKIMRRGEMTQVISNLMMNSIYAMQTGSVLSISVGDALAPRDGIVLTIQDDGVGIAETDLPRVFEAFFTTSSPVGTGIGLVAKKFVVGHGGQIDVEAGGDGENHGTTVRVFLPVAQRMIPPAMVRPRRIEWATKCGRSFRSCLQHRYSGIEFSRRGRERSLLRSRTRVRSPQIYCSLSRCTQP